MFNPQLQQQALRIALARALAQRAASQQADQQQALGMAGGAQPPGATKTTWREGQLAQGNIDLHHRPVVHNPDGSISTVRSITVTGDNGQAMLLPTVSPQGTILSNPDAVALWQRSGQNLGTFANEDVADRYAQDLHRAQALEYGTGQSPIHGIVGPQGRLDDGGVPMPPTWDWRRIQQELNWRSRQPAPLTLGKQTGTNTRTNIKKAPSYHPGDDAGS